MPHSKWRDFVGRRTDDDTMTTMQPLHLILGVNVGKLLHHESFMIMVCATDGYDIRESEYRR